MPFTKTRLQSDRLQASSFFDGDSLWSAVAWDTAGKLREVISRPGGETELSRWWSEAQPPEQGEEDCSRPGRDAGITLVIKSAFVLRPFRARLFGRALPVAALRFATG
jgi:hypothetical protein